MSKNVRVYDIQWDIDEDGEDIVPVLPSEIVVELNASDDGAEDWLSDYLSDTFGFCHKGFKYCEVSRKKKYVATAVDYGNDVDGKSHILGVFDTEEEAEAYVRNDIEEFVDKGTDDSGKCAYEYIDFDAMYIYTADNKNGCEWNIEEIEV